MLLMLLTACGPDRDPVDIATIDRLTTDLATAQHERDDARRQSAALRDALTERDGEIDTWRVVGLAYRDLAKLDPAANELVVCQPIPVADGNTPVGSDATATPVRTVPWIQVGSSADCGMPVVLSLVDPDQEDNAPIAATDVDFSAEPGTGNFRDPAEVED